MLAFLLMCVEFEDSSDLLASELVKLASDPKTLVNLVLHVLVDHEKRGIWLTVAAVVRASLPSIRGLRIFYA